MKTLDCLIVLSGGFTENGRMGNATRRRLDRAIELYKAGVSDTLIMSGCNGGPGLVNRPIAYHMSLYALQNGVMPSKIYIEPDSLDTVGNAVLTKQIADELRHMNIGIVTCDFHSERAEEIFRFVYGPGYSIATIPVATDRGNDAATIQKEKASLDAFKRTFAGIQPGDVIGIANAMVSSHPFYRLSDQDLTNFLLNYAFFSRYCPEGIPSLARLNGIMH